MDIIQKIEAIFVSQMQEEELRARRTLRILRHQEERIERLEAALGEQEQVQQQQDTSEDFWGDKSKSRHLNQGEIYRRQPLNPFEFDDLLERKDNSSTRLSNDWDEGGQGKSQGSLRDRIRKEMKSIRDVLLRSKWKIESLERWMVGLERPQNNLEVVRLRKELSGWRSTIDNALVTIDSSTMLNNAREWRTALEFFTPQQALHFLSARPAGDL